MANNEKTTSKIATLAAKALQKPSTVTKPQIRSLAASVLTQTADRKPPPKKR